jgi:hypothetical protein
MQELLQSDDNLGDVCTLQRVADELALNLVLYLRARPGVTCLVRVSRWELFRESSGKIDSHVTISSAPLTTPHRMLV